MAYADRRAEERRLGFSKRANWGTFDRPMEPPPSLPPSHAESANKFLRRRGWQLTKSLADGSWILGRVPDF